ncbi:Serum albumin [Myotis davidii]|uniref:Albumin n=1 Tax=Myotis davidii TaxID=225400 RepID=L5LI30_MYODS|nr:Serum albumin [Myotis davidii]
MELERAGDLGCSQRQRKPSFPLALYSAQGRAGGLGSWGRPRPPAHPGLHSRRGWGPKLTSRSGWGPGSLVATQASSQPWPPLEELASPSWAPLKEGLHSRRGWVTGLHSRSWKKKEKEGLGVAGVEKPSLAAAAGPKAWVPVESLGDLAECCAKQEPERNQCFLKHKDDDLDIPPLAATDPSAICTAFHQFEQKVLGTFIYEIARRHPYFYGPALLYYTQEYKGDLTEGCQGAGADARLGPKLDALQKEVLRSAYREEFKCSMLQNSGENALQKWFVSDLTKRFPNADFMMVSKLATDFTKVHKECCQSDMLECADDWADLTKYMCENQASISPTLKECCNKPVLEKSHCLAEKAGDNSAANVAANVAANLAPVTAAFVENKDVCKNYMEAKDDFLGKFLYEYSKRHPDYPLDEFQPLVNEPHEIVKKTCEVLGNLGEYGFQNVVLVDYTKKVPQVSTPTLVDFSRKLARAGSECCKLPESQRTACSDDHLFKILNKLCVAHEKSPVSDRVTKCCTGSLVNRPSCFYALEVDETYVPKEFSAETFTFHADVCTLPEPEQQVKKQT